MIKEKNNKKKKTFTITVKKIHNERERSTIHCFFMPMIVLIKCKWLQLIKQKKKSKKNVSSKINLFTINLYMWGILRK